MKKSKLMIVEGALVIITLVLAVLWIRDPSKNYEPYTILCGGLIAFVDILRRRQPYEEPHEPQEVLGEDPIPTDVIDPVALELLDLVESEEDIESRGIVEISQEVQPGVTNFFTKLQYSGSPVAMKSRSFRKGIEELIHRNWLYPAEYNESTNTITYEYRVQE